MDVPLDKSCCQFGAVVRQSDTAFGSLSLADNEWPVWAPPMQCCVVAHCSSAQCGGGGRGVTERPN
jgi:hypothetical protein